MTSVFHPDCVDAVDYDPFASGHVARVVPTTEPQREIWLANQLGMEASLAFNESVSLRLRGALDVAALQQALSDLLARHDVLRANVGPEGETLCMLDRVELTFEVLDLGAHSNEARATAVADCQRLAVETPFDLRNDRLFRAGLLRLASDEHLLMMTAHHIVCDGWSWWVLVRELGALYALHSGAPSQPLAPPEHFADYALALAAHPDGETIAGDEEYWLSRFSQGVPVLELPLDRPRPARRSFASSREDYLIEAELVEAIRKLGARRGASLFATLLTCFAGLLARLSAQSQVVIGIPAAGQSVDGHDNLVGHCVNLLPLRFDLDLEQPVSAAIDATRELLMDALDHQRYTFGTLLQKLKVERDPSRPPLVSVMFNIDQALDGKSGSMPGLEVEFSSNPRSFEDFELFVNAVQVDGALRLECQFNRDLFNVSTIHHWMGHFRTLLRAMVGSGDEALGRLPLLAETERHQLLERFNDTQLDLPRDICVHELFEARAAATPSAVAVVFEGEALSYGELNARANRVAHQLRSLGVGPETPVAVCVERSPSLVVALVAVLKAGGACVPIDPLYPPARQAAMLADCKPVAILTRPVLYPHLGTLAPQATLLCIDQAQTAMQFPDSDPGRSQGMDAGSLAYVIYTSGSTGQPKGVELIHRGTVNLLESMRRRPGIGTDDRLLAVTTMSFDIAVIDVFLPLLVGAQLHLACPETALDGSALSHQLAAEQITIMQATPSIWRMLLDVGWTPPAGFKVLCGGETMGPELAARLAAGGADVWNMYGPTEATVCATCWKLELGAPGTPLGRPTANTRVYVLDPRGQPVPAGVAGEIHIGGAQVARGYLKRPGLTAERFLADPFAREADGRMYRTGDFGRWRADGNLEFIGRSDFQVKVRGFRIELGDIEAHLTAQPGIAETVVIACPDSREGVRLVAYAVARSGHGVDTEGLRRVLETRLPAYMVPGHIVALSALPRLSNGKVDRQALPIPGPDVGYRYLAPRNALERIVAGEMATLLGAPQVGVDEDFFLIGGHSLLGAQLISRLNELLDGSLTLRSIFDAPTPMALAALMGDQTGRANASVIPARADQRRAPLSPMQQRLWVLEQMQPGRVVYNTPSAHRLRGVFDAAAFQAAFSEVVRRQPSLRTVIVDQDGTVMQVVRDEVDSRLKMIDLSAVGADAREREMFRQMEALVAQPFEIEGGLLFRACLFRMGDQEHLLFFMTHHIIWDGWSFDLLHAEMAALYSAFTQGLPSPLPPLAVTYGDFCEWHVDHLKSDEIAVQVDYWKRHLAGALEPLQLPLDQPRPPENTGDGATDWSHIDADLGSAVQEVGARADATLFMTLLAAYYVLLHRTGGQRDLVVGVPVRNRDIEALEPVMGFFVNMLPLRMHLDPEQPFLTFVEKVRETVLDAFSHSDVPFEHLVRELDVVRDPSRSPVYQAVFSFQDARRRKLDWGGLHDEHVPLFQRGAATDLGLWFLAHGSGLSGGLTYNTDVFSGTTAALLNRRYVALLHAVCRDPNVRVGDIDMMCDEDRDAQSACNATGAPVPEELTLHALLDRQANATPDRCAVRFEGGDTSYAQLQARSNRIAAAIRARGVRPGDLVGICLNRNVDLIASMIGVLKAGGAYVPLDPFYPLDRLQFMVEDARLALVVSQGDHADGLGLPRRSVLLLDTDAAELDAAPSPHAELELADGEAIAYVIYTSGSTGRPKGVQVPHRAVLNFLESMRHAPGLDSHDRLLAVTTTSFDIAVLEVFLPLSVGAVILFAGRDTAMDGHAMVRALDEDRATVMQATPSTWRMLVDAGWSPPAGFRILCGGEPLAADLAAHLCALSDDVWNMYGPTETTVWSTCWRVRNLDGGITIGKPIANTTVHILDERLQPCPIGVAGEICIGGRGVATGYLNRPELTAERFLDDPFANGAGAPGTSARLYRTGDRGRWRTDGELEHLGRLDSQIKLRGHRIELEEISNNLLTDPGVARAIVIPREDRPGDVRLVAYVVPEMGAGVDQRALLGHLRKLLPDYMVPQHVVALSSLPLLPNGKIDRHALPPPSHTPTAATAATDVDGGTGPGTAADPRVVYLQGVWSELLGTPAGPQDNFFDLGGHSMLAVEMANRVSRDTGVRLKLMRLVSQSLEQMAMELPVAPVGLAMEEGMTQAGGSRLGRGLRRLFGRSQASAP
ncbi:MAG: amino acid adenylation domain-containing protein [Lysobacter sp.]